MIVCTGPDSCQAGNARGIGLLGFLLGREAASDVALIVSSLTRTHLAAARLQIRNPLPCREIRVRHEA